MQTHRFQNLLNEEPQDWTPRSSPSAGAFSLCPIPLAVCPADRLVQQQIYQLALEQAQAVVRPSWLERDPLGHWN
jgi:hypothetical protein